MTWSLSNIQELGVKGVSPHLENDGDNTGEIYQLYYSSTERGGLAVDGMSKDLELTQQGTINLIQDLTIVTTKEGIRRAYYIEKDPNTGKHEIFTALISEDGLSLSEASSTGISNNGDEAWGVPDAVVLPDGKIRIYWVDTDTQAETLANEVILSATSTTSTGTSFIADDGRRAEGGYVDFEILKAEENDWIAIMSSSPVTIPDKPQGIFIGVSEDGISWEINEENLAPTEKSYLDPTGLLFHNSENKWRIIMSSSLSILGDREYSLVSTELTFTNTYLFDNTTTVDDLVKNWFSNSTALSSQSSDISDSQLAITTNTWEQTININRVSRASSSGGLIQAKQITFNQPVKAGSVIEGGTGADTVRGLAGWDVLDGSGNDDLVHGGNGRDIISGGAGADELHGDFGWNTYRSEKDAYKDLIVIKSDQYLSNWIYGKAGNNPNGEKVDIIEGLDATDEIKIVGVGTADLTFGEATAKGVSGIGIYAKGALEGLYTGGDLTTAQIQSMTHGTLTTQWDYRGGVTKAPDLLS